MIALSKETLAVYLLDDDSSVLKATRRLLDSAGWNVKAFTDPIAFLEHAAMHSPSVAVIDIRMPAMNGLEVQTRLRRVAPSTRVIVLTIKVDRPKLTKEHITRLENAEATALDGKPLNRVQEGPR